MALIGPRPYCRATILEEVCVVDGRIVARAPTSGGRWSWGGTGSATWRDRGVYPRFPRHCDMAELDTA